MYQNNNQSADNVEAEKSTRGKEQHTCEKSKDRAGAEVEIEQDEQPDISDSSPQSGIYMYMYMWIP